MKRLIRPRLSVTLLILPSCLLLLTLAYGQQTQTKELTLQQCGEWLKSESLDFRVMAVDGAMNRAANQRQEVISLLHVALKDTNNIVRLVAARRIQHLKDTSSIEPLVAALRDPDALIDNNELNLGGYTTATLRPEERLRKRLAKRRNLRTHRIRYQCRCRPASCASLHQRRERRHRMVCDHLRRSPARQRINRRPHQLGKRQDLRPKSVRCGSARPHIRPKNTPLLEQCATADEDQLVREAAKKALAKSK